MLTGSYFNSVDEKGRVIIPDQLRHRLGERIWLVKGVDDCLSMFTQEAWKEFIDEYITNRTLKDPNARRLQRIILSSSRERDIDKSGRIILPQDHRDFAGIGKEVVFLGCGDRIELWSSEAYEKEIANIDLKELMSIATESNASAAVGD